MIEWRAIVEQKCEEEKREINIERLINENDFLQIGSTLSPSFFQLNRNRERRRSPITNFTNEVLQNVQPGLWETYIEILQSGRPKSIQ